MMEEGKMSNENTNFGNLGAGHKLNSVHFASMRKEPGGNTGMTRQYMERSERIPGRSGGGPRMPGADMRRSGGISKMSRDVPSAKVSRSQTGRDGNYGILDQAESVSRHGPGTGQQQTFSGVSVEKVQVHVGGNETGGNTITRNGIKWRKVTEDRATVKREVGSRMTGLAGSRRGQGTATGDGGSAGSKQFGGGMSRGYGRLYSERGTPLSTSNTRSAEIMANVSVNNKSHFKRSVTSNKLAPVSVSNTSPFIRPLKVMDTLKRPTEVLENLKRPTEVIDNLNRPKEVIDLTETMDVVVETPMIEIQKIGQEPLSKKEIKERYYGGINDFEEKSYDINRNETPDNSIFIGNDADGGLKLVNNAIVNPNITVSVVNDETKTSKNKESGLQQLSKAEETVDTAETVETVKLNDCWNTFNFLTEGSKRTEEINQKCSHNLAEAGNDSETRENQIVIKKDLEESVNIIENSLIESPCKICNYKEFPCQAPVQVIIKVMENTVKNGAENDGVDSPRQMSQHQVEADQQSWDGDNEERNVTNEETNNGHTGKTNITNVDTDNINFEADEDTDNEQREERNVTKNVAKKHRIKVCVPWLDLEPNIVDLPRVYLVDFKILTSNAYKTCSCRRGACLEDSCPCERYRQECQEACACGDNCANKGLTEGEGKLLALAISKVHGTGCVAGEDIKEGELVGEYVGEVISTDDAEKRKSKFLFTTGDKKFVIDASKCGSLLTRMNHKAKDCGANCEFRLRRIQAAWRVGIWALQDIPKGEELFADYGTKYGPIQQA